MALDMSKIKGRLDSLKSTNTKSKHLWKPAKGKNVVRIIPYRHQKDNPFIELLFHYGINNKTYLSPASFGRPDPIVELSTRLKKAGDKEQWLEGRKMEPKMRVYVPILVRGHEEEGVKFWGMGKQTYQEILSIISDVDYGDITDLKNGRDIIVEHKDKTETGKAWGETSVRARPQVTPAFDSSNTTIRESISETIDFLTLYPEPSYEDLVKVLNDWLNAPKSDDSGDGDAVPPADDEDEAPKSPSKAAGRPTSKPADEEAPAKSVTAEKGAPKSSKAVADEFDSLFNQS